MNTAQYKQEVSKF